MKKLVRIVVKMLVLIFCATAMAMLACYVGSGGDGRMDGPILCGHNIGLLWFVFVVIGGLVVLVTEYQRRHEDSTD
jgi:hypothetical protein